MKIDIKKDSKNNKQDKNLSDDLVLNEVFSLFTATKREYCSLLLFS